MAGTLDLTKGITMDIEGVKKRFVPATQLHEVPLPDKTQASIDHLKSLGYKVIAPRDEKLRAA